MMKPQHHLPLLIALLAMPLHALAQADEDEKFDEALRSFGFTSGAAYQCAAESERGAIQNDVRKAYSGLVRLFGTDYAFFYAASFGAATSMDIDTAKCAEYSASFRRALSEQAR